MFFNSFIINWTEAKHIPQITKEKITIPIVTASAQIIDGQHRLAGLEEAMKERVSIGEQSIIITLCQSLTTEQAAKIFLNINTEQKPVPKSLIYDLFGIVVNDEEHSINRSTDIARDLNDDEKSALYKLIKFPGTPKGVGSIELSTFVSALKQHLKPNGVFYNVNLRSFDYQKNVINNYFAAIKDIYEYDSTWYSNVKNPFVKAAGFNGAIDYLANTLILKCAEKSSFSTKTMKKILNIDSANLLTWNELKGMDGKTARLKVKEFLESSLLESLPEQHEYEF
jgi:DGQHR domain-containing protein